MNSREGSSRWAEEGKGDGASFKPEWGNQASNSSTDRANRE